MLARDIAVRSTRSEISIGQVISFKFLVDIQWFNVLAGCGVVSSGCNSHVIDYFILRGPLGEFG